LLMEHLHWWRELGRAGKMSAPLHWIWLKENHDQALDTIRNSLLRDDPSRRFVPSFKKASSAHSRPSLRIRVVLYQPPPLIMVAQSWSY
jgi:hypothetical protein